MPSEPKPRQRFAAALDRRPLPGRVPHFELAFFLTMEAFGRIHPSQRRYQQWLQMSERERELHRRDQAELYLLTARRYRHDAIFLHPVLDDVDETCRLIDVLCELGGDEYFLLLHGDASIGIPDGSGMETLAVCMVEEPEALEEDCQRRVDAAVRRAERFAEHGRLDGFALCSDYCFNSGPFCSLPHFDRFILPYLRQLIAGYRRLGLYTIKHSDGNIMPILDRLVDCRPYALHSLSPQGDVDIAEVVDRVGEQVALCGNVHCGLLQTGSEDECIASARYALEQGLRAPGYIFSTSNCVYTGMPLERYELIQQLWWREGIRQPVEVA